MYLKHVPLCVGVIAIIVITSATIIGVIIVPVFTPCCIISVGVIIRIVIITSAVVVIIIIPFTDNFHFTTVTAWAVMDLIELL